MGDPPVKMRVTAIGRPRPNNSPPRTFNSTPAAGDTGPVAIKISGDQSILKNLESEKERKTHSNS
jgi:hypothetical protein